METHDGSVAMLRAVNDKPLSEADATKEQERLDDLLADPGKQRHRKLGQDEDTQKALKVLRAMPNAFIYQYAGTVQAGSGSAARFVFSPNPSFMPPDLETQVLTAMTGEVWIDPVQVRVMHLQASLQQDVEFGWGVLGRLYKGGWINMDNADMGGGVWHIVRFQMNFSARVLIRTKSFETLEEESHFSPVTPTWITGRPSRCCGPDRWRNLPGGGDCLLGSYRRSKTQWKQREWKGAKIGLKAKKRRRM